MDPPESTTSKPRLKPKLNLSVSQLPPRRFAAAPSSSNSTTQSNAAPSTANVPVPAPGAPFQTPLRTQSAADVRSAVIRSSHFKTPPPAPSDQRVASVYNKSDAEPSTSQFNSTPHRSVSSKYGLIDPLTPSSRLTLDTVVAQGRSQETFYPSAEPLSSSLRPDEPLSPNSALLSTLDAVSQLSIGSSKASSYIENPPARATYTPSASLNVSSSSSSFIKHRTTTFTTTQVSVTSSNQPTHVLRLGTGENGNGGDIMYLSTRIRIRAGNIHCLRCHTGVNAATGQLTSTVDASGTGFDPDEIFVLVNVTLRSDEGRVKYSDTVAIYCISGAFKGRFLSVDGSRSVTTKKGPIMSNAEKWRLGERDDFKHSHLAHYGDTSGGLDESLATLAPAVRNAQRTLQSGDRVCLKAYAGPYLLCADKGVVGLREIGNENSSSFEWEITKASIPYNPPWNRDRVFLTGAFVLEPTDDVAEPVKSLQQLPLSVQERSLVDDILYVLLGIEGQYIKKQEIKRPAVAHYHIQLPTRVYRDMSVEMYDLLHFVVDPALTDPSLAALARKIVVLGEFYIHVTHYVETHTRYEYGQVCHAFCAALKVLIREYTVVVAQLEHLTLQGGLSLSKVWFYIQPSMRAMECLSTLVRSCLGHHGGALLSVIAQLPTSGDAKATSVLNFLLEKASVPYLKMLEMWIYYGDLHDPYDEFMVASDDTLVKEELGEDPWSKYWEQRYTLREAHVPLFLTRFSYKILTAGKYLNVLRTCGRHVNCPFAAAITHAESVRKYDELIDNAHGFASRILVDMLRTEQDLMKRLRSIKHYFLMDQGDFFVDFMDLAETELNLRADKLLASRLESLLHLSLQSSTCSSDPYKDDLVCILSPHDLISQMEAIHERSQKVGRAPLSSSIASSLNDPGYKAIDALTLDYKVSWPLSLVISSGALNKYQMIFRHLFFCKHVERRLCDAWRNHQSTKELALRSALMTSYCLRQRMLHFQQNFVYYMMFEVISPRWHALENQLMTEITTVDDILNCHRDFLDQCLKECLLTDPDLLRVLTKLMTVCLTFANGIDRFTKPYRLDEEAIRNEREAERDRRADKKAREEADAMLNPSQKLKSRRTLSSAAPRRNSGVDLRRARLKDLSDDVRQALTGELSPFVRMTAELEVQFDTLLAEFMQQLLHRSHLQYNSHLSNLCTRLDYNGFYTQ